MDAIKEMLNVDFSYVLSSVFIILFGIKAMVSIFEWVTGKLGLETKQMRKKRENRELLMTTSESLKKLQEKYEGHIEQAETHNQDLAKDLSKFMANMMESMDTLKEKQTEIGVIVTQISESNRARDNATIEEMCDHINQKIRYYISTLHGIPEDEYDDFVRLFASYEKIGGNHGVKAKYEYCIQHLTILPVKKEIEMEEDE